MVHFLHCALEDGLVEAVAELLQVEEHAVVRVAAPRWALRCVGRQDGAFDPAVDRVVNRVDLALGL